MGIDFEPLFRILFFAIGFVPVVVIGAVASVFVAFPLWWVVIAAILAGVAVDAWFVWFAK